MPVLFPAMALNLLGSMGSKVKKKVPRLGIHKTSYENS